MSNPAEEEPRQAPHIFLLPSNLRDALLEYLADKPFREVVRLCQALGALKKVHLTSIQPPDGVTAEVVENPPNGQHSSVLSTSTPTEE